MAKLHLAQEILNIIYPVGSIYLSWNSTNPSTYFGGTWVQLKGGFLYGFVESPGTGNGTGTSTGKNNGNTGSTTLTANQLPTSVTVRENRGGTSNAGNQNWSSGLTGWGNYENGYGQSNRGQGHTHTLNNHSHSIPFIAVSVWRRTA